MFERLKSGMFYTLSILQINRVKVPRYNIWFKQRYNGNRDSIICFIITQIGINLLHNIWILLTIPSNHNKEQVLIYQS